MAFIETHNLIYKYEEASEGDRSALFDVNIKIHDGEFVAIVGENGSGKSTLAKCLNGLNLPSKGDVIVDGYKTSDDEHIWDIRSNVAMVFQNPDNQIVSSIIEDDVAFGPENIGVPPEEIRERVDKSLKAVDMYHLKDKAPHMLSGGQKQRIAIAGAIAMNPKCIIFDEPTAMLDPRGRATVMNIIEKLHEGGMTIILITHFMEEAVLADRIIIMNKGKVFKDGKPKEIFKNPDTIKEAGLEETIPQKFSRNLSEKVKGFNNEILTEEELVEAICLLKQKI